VVQEDGEWWVGWVKEIRGVNAQERTREELLDSLRYALEDMLDLNETHALTAFHTSPLNHTTCLSSRS
jgi:predicted RNase H-like HicB family nuclease